MSGTIDVTELKETIVNKIKSKYGSLDAFLETPFGKSLGKNVKTYLYPKGAVSFPILQKLCKHLGLGDLEKNTIVERSIVYSLSGPTKEGEVPVKKIPRVRKVKSE